MPRDNKDRQANFRLISYFIKHTSDKTLNKIINQASAELAKRSAK